MALLRCRQMRLFFGALLWFSCHLCLWAGQYLGLNDIQPFTQKMLSVHVLYRQIDERLFAQIINNYFQEFDPLKLYLLQSEVDVYTKANPIFFKEALSKFQQQDYTLFEELNRVIQKSIWRARQWNRPQVSAAMPSQSFDPLEARAKSVQELQRRWQQFWSVKDHAEQEALKDWLTKNEDEYLYRTPQGHPMQQEQKQHVLALRILKALASSLDAHTAFFSADEARTIRERLEQTYVGIGIWFENQGGRWIVKQVLKGSPAEQSGQIHPGDELVMINGRLTAGQPQALEWIKGRPNDKVTLSFNHQGERVNVELVFKKVELEEGRVHSSYRECSGGGIIGYIAMDSFYESDTAAGPNSYTDMLAAIRQLKRQGNLRALILDFRGNSGGFLDQAVKVAGLFIGTGVVAIAKYSDGSMNYFRDTDPYKAFNGPVLVMTSRMSASAAEIVAQALHDYGVALVVGDRATFGKGSIQIQTITDPKSAAFYKVTVGRYYTVSGQSTQLRGATIDFVVPGPLDQKPVGEIYEPSPLSADRVSAAYADTLRDIPDEDRLWFMRQYLPSLQQPNFRWKTYLPRLQELSQRRVQNYFNEKPYEKRSAKELIEFQLEESFRIAEDMIKNS